MRIKHHWVVLAAILLPLLMGAGRLAGHEGPEHDIAELTEHIEKLGESPSLLIERAIEYRVLGKWTEATRDLDRATRLDAGNLHAYRELGRVQFLSGKTNDAIETVTKALNLKIEDPVDVGALRVLRAEFLRSKSELKKALEDCNAGIAVYKQNPEWYMLRSDLQERLKLTAERVAGLDEGLRETGAAILDIERVEALIANKEFATALTKIESELATSRVQSSWLIRRAQVFLGTDRRPQAETDLKAALLEIDSRLNPTTPDVPLLMDKALAHELMLEPKDALRYYELARDNGADDTIREKIKALKDEIAAADKAAGEGKSKDPESKDRKRDKPKDK